MLGPGEALVSATLTRSHFDSYSKLTNQASDRELRICLMGAGFETENMGIGALTTGAIKSVLAQFPRARLSLLGYSPEPAVYTVRVGETSVPVALVNIRFSKKVYLSNNIAALLLMACILKLFPLDALRRWFVANNQCLRHMNETDLVASIAGGDSFSDIYGIQRLLYVCLPQILAILLGKRLVLLPQTIGPFRSKLAKTIARYILRHAERVYSRDHQSLKESIELLGHDLGRSKFAFCYDLGFVLDPTAPRHLNVLGFDTNEILCSPLVGFNISGLLWNGGYTRSNMFGLRADYKGMVRDAIDLLITKKHAKVLLVPHVFGLGADSESDAVVCGELYELLKDKYPGQIAVAQGTYDQGEIKYIIGQCDFFVGSRMHACIAAVSQNIPVVCIAYSRKFTGVMETVGIDELVADARTLTKDEVLNLVANTFDDSKKIHDKLAQKMPEVKKSILSLFSQTDFATPADMHQTTFVSPT
jgi:polysaccharide pyruvyl transferase WcaK-like protein